MLLLDISSHPVCFINIILSDPSSRAKSPARLRFPVPSFIKSGIIQTLVEAGGELNVPACGPCLGAYGGCLAPGETAISSANRNFKGRMGCKEDTGIYLGSPATVAASVIEGRIVEPPKEVFS